MKRTISASGGGVVAARAGAAGRRDAGFASPVDRDAALASAGRKSCAAASAGFADVGRDTPRSTTSADSGGDSSM